MEKIKKERIRKILIITDGVALLIAIAGIFFSLLNNEKTAGICLLLLAIIVAIDLVISLILEIPERKTNEEIANEY